MTKTETKNTVKTLKKITLRDVTGLDKEEMLKVSETDDNILMVIKGEVYSYGSVSTNFGESKFLRGEFAVHNLKTGEMFQSNKAYLPQDFTDSIISKLSIEGVSTVKISNFVRVVPSAKSSTKYTYMVEELLTPEAVDLRRKLWEGLQDDIKLLK